MKRYDLIFSDLEKKEIEEDYTIKKLSLKEINEKYNIKSHGWLSKFLSGKTRSISEGVKNIRKRHPEKFKHSDETKQKLRIKQLQYLKEHPEKTAWRLKNMSYPEKCFQKILEDNGLDKKYLIYREYSVFPYYIDFAFVDEKLAVEIDGSQHLEEDRKKKDEEKDILLLSNGWRILRITANEVLHNREKVIESVLSMLSNDARYDTVGILTAPKSHDKVKRGEDGLSDKQREANIAQRRVERPSKEELSRLLKESNFTTIGKTYGVSDNAIRRWCKAYGLPHRRKDMQVS